MDRRCFLDLVGRGAWAGPLVLGAGCASRGDPGAGQPVVLEERELALLGRLTWGASPASAAQWARQGRREVLNAQLYPGRERAVLPAAVQERIDAMTLTRTPLPALAADLDARRRDGDRQDYQQRLSALGREAASRSLLMAVHSPQQLREQMTWFWCNHFSVGQTKANLRLLVGDHEMALRERALGRFRDLLIASTTHAAMLRYLDNEQNAAGRINENLARELMELHTLGVNGGYSQRDVQELARVLTGLGINLGERPPPRLRPEQQGLYRREGLTEFQPGRHDMGDKTVLGRLVRGRGWDEIIEQLDALARHPATARHVCGKLAVFMVSDDPPPELVERLAQRFQATDGDIARTLETLFEAPEFSASLGRKFKDPMHFVVSALRMAGDSAPLDMAPVLGWLNRLGQTPFGRTTPDGYPLDAVAWSGSGQMATRFDVARQMARTLTVADDSLVLPLSVGTRATLAQARTPQERLALLLSSPEFMQR